MLRSSSVSALLVLAALALGRQASAARYLAADPEHTSALSEGLGPYLQKTPKYNLFLQIAQKLNESTGYSVDTEGWFDGPTNQTILLVSDDNIRDGFADVAERYNISNPETFVDRLIKIADASTDPQYGTGAIFSQANYAAFVLRCFIGSHTLELPNTLSTNDTIMGTPYEIPVNLTTGVSGFYTYTGVLQAYAAEQGRGNAAVFLRQEGGLLHATDGLIVPNFNQSASEQRDGEEDTLIVFELDGMFLYGDYFGGADEVGHSGAGSVQALADSGF